MRLRLARGLRVGEVLAVGHALLGNAPEVDHFLLGVLALELLKEAFGGQRTIESGGGAGDAVIFDQLSRRSVRYSAPGTPSITVEFPDFPILGLWSKAPGEFVCIEPWFGMTAASDFSGEYDKKPHQFVLGPSESREFTYGVMIEHPAP